MLLSHNVINNPWLTALELRSQNTLGRVFIIFKADNVLGFPVCFLTSQALFEKASTWKGNREQIMTIRADSISEGENHFDRYVQGRCIHFL